MIYITFKGTEYEIPYDNDTLELSWAIDSTFDHGYFETTPLEAGSGLDFSKRIPRDLKVRIVDRDREFIFKTSECYVEKYSYSLNTYIHKINLISETKELTVLTMENMTLTQPKGDFGLYSHSVNQAEVTISNTTTPYVLSYTNTVNSNTSYYNGMEVLTLDTFKVSHILDIFYLPTITNLELTVNIKYNGVIIRTNTIDIPASLTDIFTGKTKTETFTFNHTPSSLGTYSVEIVRDVAIGTDVEISSSFSMTAQTVLEKPVRTYAQLVDKMLRNTEYVLTPDTRSRLNITAPEGKYEGYMVFDGLQKIASELRALVKVEGEVEGRYWALATASTPDIDEGGTLYDYSPYDYDVGTVLKLSNNYYVVALTGDTFKGVRFKFFDKPNTFDVVGEIQRSEQAELEDYVSALELNTENVIKPLRYSPHKNGWGTLRSLSGIGQMTTDNIGYETEDNIEKLISVKVKGLESTNASGTEVWTVNDVTDITEYVVEQRQYDTFLSEANYLYAGKQVDRKNNHLYYIQGDNKIYGMSYIGETENRQIGQPNVTRSLYETILTARSIEIGERVTRTSNSSEDDPGLTGDLNIELQITYSNITDSRARVYKDDQSGFENERIKYMNESSNVNETDSIGSYAQQLVNRLGGTKIMISGVVDEWEDIAPLGDVDSQGRVYTLVTVRPSDKLEYEYTMVQDYNVISSYIGVNSRHRVEEISSNSTTKRTLRYTSKLIFTEQEEVFSTRISDYTKLLDTLGGTSGNGLNYGYLECRLPDATVKKIHLSIDSDSKGKTIEIKWGLKNNYSAGLKRYEFINSSSETLYMNSDVGYTDYYGKVNDILFGVYFDSLNTYDKALYPEASSDDGDGLFTIINDTIDKDAGEILQGLIEIPILSENPKVRVYDGFAKWNRIVEGTERIRAGLLTYTPIKNATRVDITRIRDITPTVNIGYNDIEIIYTTPLSHKGIVFYNVDTLEMLLAYVDDLNGSQELSIPYKIEDGIVGGGINLAEVISITLEYTGELSQGSSTKMSLEGNINLLIVPDIGQDEYGDTLLTYHVGLETVQNLSSNMSLEGNIHVDIVKDIGEDEYGETVVLYNVVGETSLKTNRLSLEGQIFYDIETSGLAQQYDWASTSKTSTTPDQTCDDESDLGNVTSYLSTSCSWSGSNIYFSATDLTTSQPSCSEGATYTVCTFQPTFGNYSCRDYEGNETTTTVYRECKLVNI